MIGLIYVNNTYYTGVHLQAGQPNLYFNGRAIQLQGHAGVTTDRLGSVRANAINVRMNYYPYGGEVGTETAEGRVKFGTYMRDSAGVDYAGQRYYSAVMGRFLTPDPYRASASSSSDPSNPQSWNRYAYVLGDPINFLDPSGRYACTWEGCANDPNCDNLDTKYDPGTGPCYGSWGGIDSPDYYAGTDSGPRAASDQDRFRDRVWLLRAKNRLTTFTTSSKDCLTDLSKFGLDATKVDNYAKTTALVNYDSLPIDGQRRFNPGADLTAVKLETNFIVYNTANFWQGTFSEMLGSLMHEFVHFNRYDLKDTDIQSMLGLDKNATDTSNVSKKLEKDCFPNAKP